VVDTLQPHTYDYDTLQDMLYILFEPVPGATFHEVISENTDQAQPQRCT